MHSEVNIVSAKFVMMLRSYLAKRGDDLAPLLRTCGFEDDLLTNPDAELHIKQFARIMEVASQEFKDPGLALSWAACFPLSGTGILGYVIQHSSDVREALENSVRYGNLTMSPVDPRLAYETYKGRDAAEFSWNWPYWLEPGDSQYKLFMAAMFALRLRADTSRPWHPLAVRLQAREAGCPELMRKIFGPDTTFNAPRNAVIVASADLVWTYTVADRRLLDVLRHEGERLLARLPARGALVQQVRSAILERLGKGEVSLETTAEAFGLPARTLRARLSQQANVCFEDILTETRRDLAQYYLGETDMTLTEIALMLGYSELSAFTRAFQRWFGTGPRAFRRTGGRLSEGRGRIRSLV